MKRYLNFPLCGLTAIAIAASMTSVNAQEKTEKTGKMEHMHMPAEPTKLIAVIHGLGDSKVKGTVVFEKVEGGVKVTAEIGGLNPNQKHAIHVHEFGDLGSEDGTSAGGHFNPEGHDHAMPDKEMRHAGDLGNLDADANGVAKKTIVVDNITLGHGKDGILGRAVIVHAKEDDGGQPTGNAGARIGAGVIGISKDSK